MQDRPVITLTTDFGHEDPFVGVMKGVILKINPHAEIVDITNDIRPHDIREAAFTIGANYRFFPDDTIHIVVVDPGVGSQRRPKLANITGGLSGPAIKPVAVRMVHEVFRAVRIPVIGMGGIMTADDAIEFMIAGARAVAVGTANFVRPGITLEILDGIMGYMEEQGLEDIGSLTGTVDAG